MRCNVFIFKLKYRNRNGVPCESSKWYVCFVDARGVRRRLPAFTSKKESEALGRTLERLVSCRASGEVMPIDMRRWLEGLPSGIREKLARWGLLDGVATAAGKTLLQHVDDWHGYLLAKGDCKDHADKSSSRVKKILSACRFVFVADVNASKVASYLHDADLGKATRNHYLTAFKGFLTWMCKDGRATSNPVAYLAKVNAATDVRRERRVLAVDEIEVLLTTAEGEPTRHGMTGPERALLYRLALATGLRVSELASLRRESFGLSLLPPLVTVEAGYSKRGRQDTLPLSDSIVDAVRPFLATLARGQRLFPMHKFPRTAEMLANDLEAAREKWLADSKTPKERKQREGSDLLLYRDSSGRHADFHSLRHSFGSYLAASGAHPKVAQSLMRHSDINLTMSRYSHVLSGQEAGAVNKLPDFGTHPKAKQRRRGGSA